MSDVNNQCECETCLAHGPGACTLTFESYESLGLINKYRVFRFRGTKIVYDGGNPYCQNKFEEEVLEPLDRPCFVMIPKNKDGTPNEAAVAAIRAYASHPSCNQELRDDLLNWVDHGAPMSNSYQHWASSGGPNECKHGIAAGIQCFECDAEKSTLPQVGEYVLATKYADGDPCDHFCVGFFTGVTWHNRFLIADGEGNNQRANGFRRAEKISEEEGRQLVEMMPGIGNKKGPSVWSHLEEIRKQIAAKGDA